MSLSDRPAPRLPFTAYVWAAILILSFTVRSGKPTTAAAVAPAMTGTRFAEVQQAEQRTRMGFGLQALTQSPKTAESLEGGRAAFRKLARDGKSPGSSRKALILAAALKKPLEPALLADLESSLRSIKFSTSEILAERQLWEALYGSAHVLPADAEKQVRAMGLGFLEDRALADLYVRQGRRADADAANLRLGAKARSGAFALVALGAGTGIAGLLGVAMLALFLTAAITKRWEWAGRVATRPVRLPAGELLDGFLFYLALYMGVGAGIAPLAAHAPASARLGLVVAIQLLSGLAGVAYLAAKAKKCGVTLEDVGLTGRALTANVGYGILGWCAVLPITYGTGVLSQKLFHGSGATPNPILPFLASDHAPFDRALIFLLAAVGAPLFEEFFFRGALFSAFRAHLRWGAAAALSALVFALVHPMQDWLPIFALGLAFGTLRELRQSLVPGMVAHFLQNSFAFLLLTSVFG